MNKVNDIYFSLDRFCQASFSTEPIKLTDKQTDKQIEFKQIAEIRWPFKKNKIKLCCHPEMLIHFKHLSFDRKLDSFEKDVKLPIYKSHLQKAIRRGKTESAIGTVNILFTMDPVTLLRRLPIIVLEDVFLYEEFPTLIWIMCYYSKNKEQIDHFWQDYIRHLTKFLCEFAYRDPMPKHGIGFSSDDIPDDLSDQQRGLIYAIQVRKSYGGMKCDAEMLDRFSYKWTEVFSVPNRTSSIEDLRHLSRNLSSILLLQPKPIIVPNYQLTMDNFILAGVDFHPCPDIIVYMMKKHPQYSKDFLKKLIWKHSSGINYRCLQPSVSKIWQEIEPTFIKATIKIRDKYLSEIIQ